MTKNTASEKNLSRKKYSNFLRGPKKMYIFKHWNLDPQKLWQNFGIKLIQTPLRMGEDTARQLRISKNFCSKVIQWNSDLTKFQFQLRQLKKKKIFASVQDIAPRSDTSNGEEP